MSAQRLEEGIYTLTTSAYGAWTYQRRKEPIRPRLFLVPARPPPTPTPKPRKIHPAPRNE